MTRRGRRVLLLGLAALLATLWPCREPPTALAHPLDEYLQALYLTLAPDRLALELDFTPGVFVASQLDFGHLVGEEEVG